MTTRKSRFPVPVAAPQRRERTIPVGVTGGLHSGVPAHAVPPGMSPALQNITARIDGFVTPRSGLSRLDVTDFGGAVLHAAQIFDVDENIGAFSASATSVGFFLTSRGTWSDVSYLPSNITAHQGNLSGGTNAYFSSAQIYDLDEGVMLNVFTNGVNSMKFFHTRSTATTFSDFTYADTLNNTAFAKAVVAVNDRLVLFNTTSTDGTKYPNRIMWSARGKPKSFLIADGAGAEDRPAMKGPGVGAVRFRDRIFLFTEHQIWLGTPTLDDYAFRFTLAFENNGTPWPKTIAVTPLGVMFMEHDHEIYVTDGSSIVPVGPEAGDGPSRIQPKLSAEIVTSETAWAAYNHQENRYELYYTTANSTDGFPNAALFYDINARTWWPQKFSYDLSAGIEANAATFTTWDDLTGTWDSNGSTFDDFDLEPGAQFFNVFSSKGSVLHFTSDQTTDSGLTIDVRWRAPGLKGGAQRHVHLTEVWVDYENESNSSASIFVGTSRVSTGAFDSGTALSLTTAASPVYVPVWKTAVAPNFELRITDGSTPLIAPFSATLKDGSRF